MTRLLAVAASLLLVVAAAPDAAADEVGFTCRAVGPAALTVAPLRSPRGACTGVEVSDRAGKPVMAARDTFFGSGTILVSADGRRAAFIADNAYAGLRPDGSFEAFGRKGDGPHPLEALVLVAGGRRVKAWSLTELLVRPRLVSVTSSHVRWLEGDVAFLSQPLPPVLRLETSSFRRYALDTETGRTLEAVDTEPWRTCDKIAYGNVGAYRSRVPYGMRPAFAVKGEVPRSLRFFASKLQFEVGPNTLCLMATPEGLEATRVLPRLNGVTVR